MIATDIDTGKLDSLKAEGAGKIATRRLDVTKKDEIDALADETGAVDVLFNCAGFVHHGTILDCSRVGLGLHLRPQSCAAMYRMIRAFLPAMLEAREGRLDHQHVVERVLGQRRAQPLRLRAPARRR